MQNSTLRLHPYVFQMRLVTIGGRLTRLEAPQHRPSQQGRRKLLLGETLRRLVGRDECIARTHGQRMYRFEAPLVSNTMHLSLIHI